jgi:hypothetical protein
MAMSAPLPLISHPAWSGPTVLPAGHRTHLLTSDHQFMELLDRDRYSVVVYSLDTSFYLLLYVEYRDGRIEVIGNDERSRPSNCRTTSSDDTVRLMASNSYGPCDYEEVAQLRFHPEIKRVAVVLHTPRRDTSPDCRLYQTEVASGNHMSLPTEKARLHLKLYNKELDGDTGGNRLLVAVFVNDRRTLTLEAPDLCSATPEGLLYFLADTVSFDPAPDEFAAAEAPIS